MCLHFSFQYPSLALVKRPTVAKMVRVVAVTVKVVATVVRVFLVVLVYDVDVIVAVVVVLVVKFGFVVVVRVRVTVVVAVTVEDVAVVAVTVEVEDVMVDAVVVVAVVLVQLVAQYTLTPNAEPITTNSERDEMATPLLWPPTLANVQITVLDARSNSLAVPSLVVAITFFESPEMATLLTPELNLYVQTSAPVSPSSNLKYLFRSPVSTCLESPEMATLSDTEPRV